MVHNASYDVGDSVQDISGFGNHATVAEVSYPTTVTPFGISPLSSYVASKSFNLPDMNALFGSNATILCWNRIDTKGGGPFRFGSSALEFHMPFTDNNYYHGTFRTDRLSLGAAISATEAAKWHMLSISTDAVTWRMYHNGIEVASNAAESTVTLDAPSSGPSLLMSSATISAGVYTLGGPAHFFSLWNRTLNPKEHYDCWNPATRWDMYRQPKPMVIASEFVTAGGRVMSSLAGSGGLAGHGGIAGQGGGLAGA